MSKTAWLDGRDWGMGMNTMHEIYSIKVPKLGTINVSFDKSRLLNNELA